MRQRTAETICSCPRCGYDLRGQLAGREEAERGTCSECGLEFLWRDVLDPMRNGPRWSIEYEPAKRRLPLAAVKTWLRMLWPWGFWSKLQMHHEPRWRRIALLYLFALIPFVLLYVVFQTSVAVYVRWSLVETLKLQAASAPQRIAQLQQSISSPSITSLEPAHRARIVATIRRQIAYWQAQAAQRPMIDMPYHSAIIEAVFFPRSAISRGTINKAGYAESYPAPVTLPGYLPSRAFDLWRRVSFAAPFLIPFALALIYWPLSLGLLPISRKRAKVRWHHIWRIASYSGVLFILLVTVAASLGAFWAFVPQIGPTLESYSGLLLLGVPIGALVIWWGSATGRYLRIRHAWSVAVLLSVLSGLCALISGGFVVSLLM